MYKVYSSSSSPHFPVLTKRQVQKMIILNSGLDPIDCNSSQLLKWNQWCYQCTSFVLTNHNQHLNMFMHLLKCAKLVFKPRLTSGYTSTVGRVPTDQWFVHINLHFTLLNIFNQRNRHFSPGFDCRGCRQYWDLNPSKPIIIMGICDALCFRN